MKNTEGGRLNGEGEQPPRALFMQIESLFFTFTNCLNFEAYYTFFNENSV